MPWSRPLGPRCRPAAASPLHLAPPLPPAPFNSHPIILPTTQLAAVAAAETAARRELERRLEDTVAARATPLQLPETTGLDATTAAALAEREMAMRKKLDEQEAELAEFTARLNGTDALSRSGSRHSAALELRPPSLPPCLPHVLDGHLLTSTQVQSSASKRRTVMQ